MITADCVKHYSMRLVINDAGEIVSSQPLADPGAQLDNFARAYVHDHGVAYERAFERVLADPENQTLVAEYGSTKYEPNPTPLRADDGPLYKHKYVGEDVHGAVRQYMLETYETDYSKALNRVLRENPSLAARDCCVGSGKVDLVLRQI